MIDPRFGIVMPNVPKDWDPSPFNLEGARQYLRRYHVPEGWGFPLRAVIWDRANGDLALVVVEFPNGRRVEVRRHGRDYATP